ncbi:hypothetical protein [Epilithonimonas sp.]|uniref:hypothetical protein n=1 Tax=Epilithonimonas sp. TaxID=2894511 RepID=UPI00289BDA83|nr:hypothetical protein [Epilithonimonas sp.]
MNIKISYKHLWKIPNKLLKSFRIECKFSLLLFLQAFLREQFSFFRVSAFAVFFLSISYINGQINNDFTIIVPASDFVDEIPKGNYLTNAKEQKQEWLFNNTGILLNSETNLMTRLSVPEAGDYHLFVRSSGNEKSAFKVIVNDQITHRNFWS